MRYIESINPGDRISDIYLVKNMQNALTKAGKPYISMTLQDKTGTLDAKIWEPGSMGINEFEALDYVDVMGDVTSFQGEKQLSVKRLRVANEGEYIPADYLPMTPYDIEEMYAELMQFVASVRNPHLNALLNSFFGDPEFKKKFSFTSAAKGFHHAFVGGLLQHTLGVTRLCDDFSKRYEILNRDLLVTAAMFHDIGKTEELSPFPANDYTDDGQLLGHISIGAMMVSERIHGMEDFPKILENELIHCILAHHGQLEYGSPKKPALAEAVALNFADDVDAKMENLTESFANVLPTDTGWQPYNKMIDSYIRRTSNE